MNKIGTKNKAMTTILELPVKDANSSFNFFLLNNDFFFFYNTLIILPPVLFNIVKEAVK